jgi:hypothetical protein
MWLASTGQWQPQYDRWVEMLAISFLMRSTAVFAANSKFGSLAGSPKMRGVDHIRAMKLEPDRAGTGVSGQRW